MNIATAQNVVVPEGYTTQVGVMVFMLEDLKARIDTMTKNLSVEEVDFLFDDEANRIGALILHLAAVEKSYQVYTFENRDFTKKEKNEWSTPEDLGKKARNELQNHPIDYYMDKWNEVRSETLRVLMTKDDVWLNSTMVDHEITDNYFCWFHVMEHQANHMGQIALILGRLPKD